MLAVGCISAPGDGLARPGQARPIEVGTRAQYAYHSHSEKMAAKVVVGNGSCNNGSIDLYRVYGGVMSNNIEVKDGSGPGTVFTYMSGKGSSVGVVKMWEPMSPLLNFFEIEILDEGQRTAIGLGVGSSNYSMSAMPGWNGHAIGYHADDGKLFHQTGYGKPFGPTCKKGDIMGCGIDFTTDCGQGYVKVWFTKNGDAVGPSEKMRRPLHGFYPLIGMHSVKETVRYLGHTYRSPDSSQDDMETDKIPHSMWARCNGVRFRGGLSLVYDGISNSQRDVGVAMAHLQLTQANHYFELHIEDVGECCEVAIGVAKKDYPLHRFPGWSEGSIAYHADNGQLYKEAGIGSEFGPKCGSGDIMGCGIRFLDPYDSSQDKAPRQDIPLPLKEVTAPHPVQPFEEYYDSDDSDYYAPIETYKQSRDKDRTTPPEEKVGRPRCVIYFTRNGEPVGESETVVPVGGFFPIVGVLSNGERITLNFFPITG